MILLNLIGTYYTLVRFEKMYAM